MAAAAILSGFGGVAILRWLWRRRTPRHGAILILAWALVFLSVPLWILRAGPEFGVVFALCAVSLYAWGVVGFTASSSPARIADGEREHPGIPSPRAAGAELLRLAVVLPLTGLASLSLALGLGRVLPVAEVDRLAFSIVALPLIWGVAAYLFLYARRPFLASAWLLALAGAGLGLFVAI